MDMYVPAYDLNHNGTIDIFDLQLAVGHFGQQLLRRCAASHADPIVRRQRVKTRWYVGRAV